MPIRQRFEADGGSPIRSKAVVFGKDSLLADTNLQHLRFADTGKLQNFGDGLL